MQRGILRFGATGLVWLGLLVMLQGPAVWGQGQGQGAAPVKTTVTSVGTLSGSGLTASPNPITSTGTIALQSCAAGQILKATSPSVWDCAADATGTGVVR